MAYSIMLDAGHGGTKDPGAVYKGRQEKDDNLGRGAGNWRDPV